MTDPSTSTTQLNRRNTPSQTAANARVIGRVLRAGVLSAATLIVIGVIIVLSGHDGPQTRSEALGNGEGHMAFSLHDLVTGLKHGDGQELILLGVLVLILTPTARVALTLSQFVRERDRLFAIMAAAVLTVLILGLLGIGA